MTKKITVTATGDSLISVRLPDYNDEDFADLVGLIQSCDVAFTNMETTLSNFQGSPVVESGGGNLSAHPDVARDLMRMGFNLTAFANNHTLNYGEHGCLATIDALAEMGFTCAGAGRNLAEARSPVYLQTDRGLIGLIGCASSFAPGQRAGAQLGAMPGRPGLNPQRYETLFVVDEEHLKAIRTIAENTGAKAQRDFGVWLGFLQDPKREGEFVFAERSFIGGEEFGIQTEAHKNDLAGNVAAIADSNWRADLTLASIHAHEQGSERWIPADFLLEFAHAAVDAGANMVIGHGPHLLRGIEIYQGKPIFYSLGNFVFQPELIKWFPPDDMIALGVEADASTSEMYDHMTNGGERGFIADRRYWETVLPLCTFENGVLVELQLHPVTLGFGEELPDRGIPRLARGELALEILQSIAALSEPFGTRIEIEDGVGLVALG
jgi:poly-gamma-glutamate capsule biosynthesis protein CapA/YwtB (metallophosphatase superfamily)